MFLNGYAKIAHHACIKQKLCRYMYGLLELDKEIAFCFASDVYLHYLLSFGFRKNTAYFYIGVTGCKWLQ